MEHASSPKQQERAPPEKMHATRNPPIYYSELNSPPGSQHSSNSAHPYCPVPSGFQYANLPVQSPHARYIEIQRAQMQGLASNPVSHLPWYPSRHLPTPTQTWHMRGCIKPMLWPPYIPYANNRERLPSIREILNPAPALRDENLTSLPPSNNKPLAMPANWEAQTSNTGDTTQSEASDVTTNGATTRQKRSSTRGLPIRGRQRPMQVATFTEVAAHTAKCDECNRRNTDGMSRCHLCGWQCCRKCLGDRGQNRSHVSSTGYHTAKEPESPPAAEGTQISSSPPTVPSPASSTVRHHLSPETPNTLPSRVGSPGEPRGRMRQDRDHQARQKAAQTLVNLSNSSPLQDTNSGSLHRGSGFGRTGGESGSRQNYAKRSHDQEDMADDPLGMQRQKRPRTQESSVGDSSAFGEEFDNPRRNPSRRARPIDMKE